MAEYPEWLLRYKTKGVYVKKTKRGYALYRGHSERVEGCRYPRFRCDEYLGIVTEADGLIPPTPSVRPGIRVLRYGVWCIAERFCGVLREVPERDGLDSALIYAHCVLDMEGVDSLEGYEGSWLCEEYPGLDMSRGLDDDEALALGRMKVQMASKLAMGCGALKERMLSLASNVYAVHVNGTWHMSDPSDELVRIAEECGVQIKLVAGSSVTEKAGR